MSESCRVHVLVDEHRKEPTKRQKEEKKRDALFILTTLRCDDCGSFAPRVAKDERNER